MQLTFLGLIHFKTTLDFIKFSDKRSAAICPLKEFGWSVSG